MLIFLVILLLWVTLMGQGFFWGLAAFGGAANQRLQIGATLAGTISATAQINWFDAGGLCYHP